MKIMKKQRLKLLILTVSIAFVKVAEAQPTLYYQGHPSPMNTYGYNSSNKMGDVDNDGDLDLVISGFSAVTSSSATILYKMINDQFVHDTTLANLNEGSVHFADVDNDNDLDILVTGTDASYVRHTKLFINDGTGYFTEDLSHGITGVSYSDADFGDIDGDGDLDLIITGESPTFLTELYLNDGAGNFSLVNGTSFSPGRGGEIKFFDSDGDGDLDILVSGGNVNPTDENTDLYINDGNGNFTVDNSLGIDDFRASSFDIADIDNDGDLDVIMNGRRNSTDDECVLYLNDGNGNFTQAPGPTFMGGTAGDIAIGDLDGDNDLDFIVMGWGPSFVNVLETYLNDGNGNYSLLVPSFFIPEGARSGEVSIGDAENDGLNDVFFTGYIDASGSRCHYYRNFTPPCESSSSITVAACDSYTVPSGDETYTADGIYEDTIPNHLGCDSIMTIDLTINSSTSSSETVTACGSYEWNGTEYTSTGTYNQTIPNSVNCDSVMTLNLVINELGTSVDVQSACNSFTWIDGNTYTSSNNTATHTIVGGSANGCDSIVTLDLTINDSYSATDEIVACDSYTWIDGNTYTTDNNTATELLTSVNGCDSLVTLDLTINTSSSGTDVQTACNYFVWIDGLTYTEDNNSANIVLTNNEGCDSTVTLDLTVVSLDPTTSVSDGTITANLAGADYQWIDCDDNNNPISGAVNQSFTAQNSGNYAVIISSQNCSVTSTCVEIDLASINDFEMDGISVYPNPNDGNFFIEVNKESYLEVLDITGKWVTSKKLHIGTNQVQLSESNGLYLVKIKMNNEIITRKISVNN